MAEYFDFYTDGNIFSDDVADVFRRFPRRFDIRCLSERTGMEIQEIHPRIPYRPISKIGRVKREEIGKTAEILFGKHDIAVAVIGDNHELILLRTNGKYKNGGEGNGRTD